ncbi:MAG: hypothetical protein IPG93_16905 [Burkholderiales bacterium]|nr:hypothetical protein [Burkholderiales bacterium]
MSKSNDGRRRRALQRSAANPALLLDADANHEVSDVRQIDCTEILCSGGAGGENSQIPSGINEMANTVPLISYGDKPFEGPMAGHCLRDWYKSDLTRKIQCKANRTTQYQDLANPGLKMGDLLFQCRCGRRQLEKPKNLLYPKHFTRLQARNEQLTSY